MVNKTDVIIKENPGEICREKSLALAFFLLEMSEMIGEKKPNISEENKAEVKT